MIIDHLFPMISIHQLTFSIFFYEFAFDIFIKLERIFRICQLSVTMINSERQFFLVKTAKNIQADVSNRKIRTQIGKFYKYKLTILSIKW